MPDEVKGRSVEGGGVELFIEYLSFDRGLSDRTVMAYVSDVERLLEWMNGRGIADPVGAGHRDLREYLYHLKDSGLAATTIRRALSSIRSFYAFLLDEGRLDADPTELLESPAPSRVLPEFLTTSEVEALLAAPVESSKVYWRDRAILELLYATGMRVSELTALTRHDVDMEERTVKVLGKGSKERLIPFGRSAADALERYLREVRPRFDRGEGEGIIFLNQRGRPLTRMSVWTTVKENADRAGLEKDVSPHTLRHTCATHLLEGGADLSTVQKLLGHSDISTTQIYTHVNREHLQSVHRSHHPRA